MRIFAVTETDAHLRLLASRGLVTERRRPGAHVDPRRPLIGRRPDARPQRRSAPPRRGWARTRLVCVDGPAGSGKTTFAGRLAAALGPDGDGACHMDDLYAGWTLTGAVARLAAGVLRPLAAGRPGALPPLRLARPAGSSRRRRRCRPPACWSSRAAAAVPGRSTAWATLRIWVEAPADAARCARGLARDGAELEPTSGARWQATRRAEFAPRTPGHGPTSGWTAPRPPTDGAFVVLAEPGHVRSDLIARTRWPGTRTQHDGGT